MHPAESAEAWAKRRTALALRRSFCAPELATARDAWNLASRETMQADCVEVTPEPAEPGSPLLLAVLDTLTDGVAVKDATGTYLLVSRIAAAMMGATPERIVGRTDRELRPHDEAVRVEGYDRDVIARGERVSYEMRSIGPDGERYLSTIQAPVRASDGQIAGVIVVTRDVTAVKRMEAELRRAARIETATRLASAVVHDLASVLTAIHVVGDVVLRSEGLPAGSRADVLEIQRAVEHGTDLAAHLLALSRQQAVAHGPVDLTALVREMERLLTLTLAEREVHLVLTLAEPLAPVWGDWVQLERIVDNLVCNARDATPSGGRVTISTEVVELDKQFVVTHRGARVGSHVRLVVEDSGKGMVAGIVARAGEPFFTTKPPGEGTGLGLATVYDTARETGGVVEIDSKPGRGTRVAVYLPVWLQRPGARPDIAGG
jgi:two-component system, cell cycle sensor histidine kinase and response regulator CckA